MGISAQDAARHRRRRRWALFATKGRQHAVQFAQISATQFRTEGCESRVGACGDGAKSGSSEVEEEWDNKLTEEEEGVSSFDSLGR